MPKKKIFDALAGYQFPVLPCEVIASSVEPGELGIRGVKSRQLDVNKWYIVGEFVGTEVFFPTPHEYSRTDSIDVEGVPYTVYDTNAYSKGKRGLHNAGMCQPSRFFPNAFKIKVCDQATGDIHTLLITRGDVVAAGQELVYQHVPSEGLHLDLFSFRSAMLMGKGPRAEEVDALIAFIRKEHAIIRQVHQSQPLHEEPITILPLDAALMDNAKKFVDIVRVALTMMMLSHNSPVYHMVSQRLPAPVYQSLLKHMAFSDTTIRTFFRRTLQDSQIVGMPSFPLDTYARAIQNALFSEFGHEMDQYRDAFLAMVQENSLEEEIRAWDDFSQDVGMRKALWRKDWDKVLQYGPWAQRVKMPCGFSYSCAEDRKMVLQLKVFVRYCLQMLSIEGDANHYVKAVFFLEGLQKIHDKILTTVCGGHTLRYDFAAVDTLEQLSKCVAYGLSQKCIQSKSFYQMILPSLRIQADRKGSMVDHDALARAMVRQDGLEAFWCMMNLALKNMRAILTNYRDGRYHNSGRRHQEHSGMRSFYRFMHDFLQPYTARYASASTNGNDFFRWRDMESSSNVRQLWQPLPKQSRHPQLQGQSLFSDNPHYNQLDGWVMVPKVACKG